MNNRKIGRAKEVAGMAMAAVLIISAFALLVPATVVADPSKEGAPSSIRIYGNVQPEGNAPERYVDWTQPFDPTVIPKDSITFNPALLEEDFGVTIGENAREKIFLRAWYEPCGRYWGSRKNYTRPTVNMEYTYMLLNTQYKPASGHAGNTLFAFPTCEIASQPGLGAWNCASKSTEGNLTRLTAVSGDVAAPYGKTVNGQIEIEKGFRNLAVGDTVQFLDHKLEVTAVTGGNYVIKVWYTGNSEPDSGKGWIILKPGDKIYFDRHNNEYSTANHDPAAGQIRTWYIRRATGLNSNIIYLGKELQRCDVFYVNGVRYDVTAIEVLDTDGDYTADAFKYITVRTKLPKGVGEVPDESVVSSQSIECIEPSEVIPVLPPFNENHYMVDDIDIPLWKQASPEREWTSQNYTGKKLDTDNDGVWIAYDVDERIIPDVKPLNITYIAEDFERRYSTNLLEKLQEKWTGANAERVDLYFLIDGSQSISESDFELQKQGLADAVSDPNVVPQDGTVRVCVIQFSDNATLEVPLTLIDMANASTVAQMIMNITQQRGRTNMSAAFKLAIDNLPANADTGIQVIDLSTDGYPTGDDSTEKVFNASDAALNAGFDVVNTLGVGLDIDEDFLKQLAHPQPWYESPGFYVHAEDYIDFMDEIREKIRVEVEGRLEESWTKLDIQSIPDMYTEFVLPELPDIKAAEDRGLYGDYLITTSLIAPQAEGDFPNKRVAFSYDPDPDHGGIDEDIYVNYNDELNMGTVRVYGHANASTIGDRNACNIEVYTNWEQPFNPTSIRKDSITFNPAILQYSAEYPMHAQGEDCDLKEYLRVWYVPQYEFYGWHEAVSEEPAIVTETTYMLIDSQDKKPWHADANRSWFPFPIVADLSDGKAKGLQYFDNEGVDSTMNNLVLLSYIGCSPDDLDALHKTTRGTIRLEKTYILSEGDTVEFLDHNLKFEGIDPTTGNPSIKITYCGNKDGQRDASPTYNIATSTQYYDRHNNVYTVPKHPDRTWYARFDEKLSGGRVMVTVGKELQTGDVFYVDGVRYEIPAIEVLDNDGNLTNGCEKFKYITIRTPFPKGSGELAQHYPPCADSQWIERLDHSTPIPVLPPMNMVHSIVDDTDVVLWKPLKLLDKWPYGDPNGLPGIEYFPCADRYLTMQYPPYAWLKYFRAVPIDTDGDMTTQIPDDWQLWEDYGGPFYPGDVTRVVPDGWQCCKCGKLMPLPDKFTIFDTEHWIANDVNERIIPDVAAVDFQWKEETAEPRYSTNLLEILNETLYEDREAEESWTKYDIQTLPDEYTEFKLPITPSISPDVYIGGEYQIYKPETRQYPGSYLITTSFIAPEAKGDLNIMQSYAMKNRFAFTFNPRESTGIYVNENPMIPPSPGSGDRFTIKLKELRNYLSIPIKPDNSDPEAIFGRGVVVYSYNATSSQWECPDELEPGKGYYVYNPWGPKTITIYGKGVSLDWDDINSTLQPGWNLIGVGNQSVSLPSMHNLQIWRYMHGYPYDEFWPVPPTQGLRLQPGEAYWIFKTA